jgi:hypothetical protein
MIFLRPVVDGYGGSSEYIRYFKCLGLLSKNHPACRNRVDTWGTGAYKAPPATNPWFGADRLRRCSLTIAYSMEGIRWRRPRVFLVVRLEDRLGTGSDYERGLAMSSVLNDLVLIGVAVSYS